MIVLPGIRWPGVNADGASASGRTAPMIGRSRPPHPLGEVRQPEPVRLDDKEDRPAVGGSHLRRADDRDQRSARAHQRGGAFEDLAPDDIEHHVDLAGFLQPAGLQVDEYVRAQPECGRTVRGAAGADHAGAQLVCELHRDGPDTARGAVDQDGLSGL